MVCLFEDSAVVNFHPLTLTRHCADLLVGTMTFVERARLHLHDDSVTLHGRAYLRDMYRDAAVLVDAPTSSTLFVNARLLLTTGFVASLPTESEWIVERSGIVYAAHLSQQTISRLSWSDDLLDFTTLGDVPRFADDHYSEQARLYEYLWDLLDDNAAIISADAKSFTTKASVSTSANAVLVNADAVFVGEGTIIRAGTVIDATDGPVIIGKNVNVMHNATILGPCFIGDNSTVKVGAKIYPGNSIGAWCKVGGEIENSIVLGYSNKQHDGFLGHSYIGSWVNLGADTNTSDLKNNYGAIQVMMNKRPLNTNRMFLGSIIGDHSKTAINTMLNTGTIIGVCCNVFGSGFPMRSIASFMWGGVDISKTFRLDEALEVVRIVMARRKTEVSSGYESMLRHVFTHYSFGSQAV